MNLIFFVNCTTFAKPWFKKIEAYFKKNACRDNNHTRNLTFFPLYDDNDFEDLGYNPIFVIRIIR